MNTEYQICTRCVMDNASDNTITFNEKGECNYCISALKQKASIYFPNEEGEVKLQTMLEKIRKVRTGKKYDCIMGLSGGLDSSYLLYLGYLWGLKILVVHIDDGFDSEISKKNIAKLIDTTKFDYIVERPDETQFNGLLKAYIIARVPNIAVPQDNLISAYMYKYARELKINYFLSGNNFALESIIQKDNTYRVFDKTNIKDINRKCGETQINKLPILSDYRRFVDQNLLKTQTLTPLNFIEYNRMKALAELNQFCNFQYYGSKHLENIFTKFTQVYWFYNKFGVDKRRSHFSSMIISDQMSRNLALKELEKPLYDELVMHEEIRFIMDKLHIKEQEFRNALELPNKQHENYKIDKFYSIYKKNLHRPAKYPD